MDRLFKRKPSKELAWTVALAAAVPLAHPQAVSLASGVRPLAQQKRSLFARSDKKYRHAVSYVLSCLRVMQGLTALDPTETAESWADGYRVAAAI